MFDMMLSDLEKHLEQLSKRSEEKFDDKVEVDFNGGKILGKKFELFKTDVTNLRSTLQKCFNNTMKSIQGGLSEFADEG